MMLRRVLFRKRKARPATVALTLGVIVAMGVFLRIGDFLESRVFYLPRPGAFVTPTDIQDVWFQNDRGHRLHAWWLPAIGTPKGTILYCHGNAGALPDHLAFTAALPSAGFNVFMFDYRGFGQSRAPGTRLRRRMLIDDTSAAIDAVIARPGVDASRLVVMGHSMGAMAASNMVAERRDGVNVRALAAVSAFSSWSGVASDHAGPLGTLLIRDHESPKQAVALLGDIPLLVMHGEMDRVVKSRHATIIAEAARKNGVPTELVLIGDADHESVLSLAANQQRVAEFFERVLELSD